RGRHHGYDWRSAREPLSTLAYDARYRIAWGQHAIARNRELAAAALGYPTDVAARYGINPKAAPQVSTALPFAVALHATSRPDKLWPEAEWKKLLAALTARGLRIVLPWGNDAERERGARLAAGFESATVPQRMPPEALAALFAAARIVVGVDTGLLHLAVAAGAPALALFGPTDPALTGVIGERAPAISLGGNGAFPDFTRVEEQVGHLLRATSERDAAEKLGR
ncbi:MAG: lipopolysaccharide heptosyltransferase I, partial [Betaproteobacteria bacterium]